MDEELMKAACLDGDLSILDRDGFSRAVNLNPQQSRLDPEVLGLELMEMQRGPFRPVRAVYELPQVVRNRTFDIVFVGLPEHEASSWWWFQELGREQPSEPVFRQQSVVQDGPQDPRAARLAYFTIVDCPADV